MPELSEQTLKWQPAQHAWPLVAVACLGLAVAVAAWFAVSAWEERLAKAKFNALASDYASALQTGLDNYLGKLLAVRSFYDASKEVDQEEFSLFTTQILSGYGDTMRLVWCPRVSREERAEFERKARQGGLGGFSIRTWAPADPLQVSPERDEYFPILYSTVASSKTATFGVDLNSEPARHVAILRARDGNGIATAQNVTIRNPISGSREGFLGVAPVYRQGVRLNSIEERRRNTLGVIVGAFQTAAVFDSILTGTKLPESVDLYLYPRHAAPDALPIYTRGSADRNQPLEPKPKAAFGGLTSWSAPLKAGDAGWDLVVLSRHEGLIGGFYRAWLVLAAVLLVFGAVLAYMWASLRHAMRLETANARILELAQTDLLTNLANRRAFLKRLTMAFTASLRGAPPFAVLYLDIDNFKDVNDTLGHAMGDALLKEVVTRLRNAVRGGDLVARFGGDEFAILLPRVADPAIAGDLAARIGKLLAAPFSVKGHKIRITSSIGIVLYSPEVAGPDAMMMRADLALYGAKDAGRNCYRFHSEDLDRQVHERVRLGEELRAALEQHELELFYQPQVELSTGRIIGLEALVRWNHKARGLLTPDVFIAIAEKTGVILPLGRFVLDDACRQLKAWQADGIAPPVLSVNVSGVQFKSAELEREIEESLARWDVDPGNLELELTETVLMEATQRHGNTLEKLRQLGTRVAIDDFGTGYSSLKYLTSYPVNRLKLAPEFVFRVTVDYRNAAVVRAAIRLANELGLEVIAEGVETEAQVRFLIGAGCEQAQGYYFSRPVAARKATELLRAGRIEPTADPMRRVAPSAA